MRKPFDSEFRVTSPYGNRADPFTGTQSWHGGVDLYSEDRVVRCVTDGYVFQSRIVPDKGDEDRTWEWGNYICVAGDDGLLTYYCHLDRRLVEKGQRVLAGQEIGIEGETGLVTGRHLHFELRSWGAAQKDPCSYIGIPNVAGYVWKPAAAWESEAHDWSRDAVEWCVQRGILKGRGDGNYALGESLTREELCVMLWRAREVL